MDFIGKCFSDKSKNWRVIDLKIYNANDFIDTETKKTDKRFCLALFKYWSEDFNSDEKILFIRDMEKTKSFYDWKMLSYEGITDKKNSNINGIKI